MKQLLSTLALLILSATLGSAQIYTGGDASLDYANGFYVDVAPVVGYRVGMLDVGIAPFFSYSKKNNADDFYLYGGRFYSQLNLLENLFVHAEIEGLNTQKTVVNPDGSSITSRKWVLGVPIGAGYRQRLGDNVTAHAMVLYDILLDEDSPKENPVVRAGVTYNF